MKKSENQSFGKIGCKTVFPVLFTLCCISIGNFYGNFSQEKISAKIAARKIELPQELLPSHPKKTETVTVKFTAYYGPKKSQRKFFTKNFKKEVRLNGKGELTAYGTKPRLGIVATDPEVFPRGTLFLAADPLDGQKKIFVAEDTGGGIKGHHLDFFAGWGKAGYERVRKIQRAGDTMTVTVLNMPT